MITPGTRIWAGKDYRRQGTVAALVTFNQSNIVYLLSAYHVLAGYQRPATAQIYNEFGEVIADYQRATPLKKPRGIDYAFAALRPGVAYSNEINGYQMTAVASPNAQDEVYLYGGETETYGRVSKIGERITAGELYSLQIAFDHSPAKGDSGSPWIDEDYRLVGLHLGRLGSTKKARAIWLEPMMAQQGWSLA